MQQLERIGELFVRQGLVTQADIASALEKQKQLGGHKQLGDLLVSMGLITEKDRVRVLGEHWGIEFIDLAEVEIPYEVATLVSQDLARRYKVLPVQVEGNRLKLAMKNPLDIFATDEIRLITGKEVEPMIATEEDILLAITEAYRNDGEAVGDVLKTFEDDVSLDNHRGDDENISIEELKNLSEEAPVVKLANMIIAKGILEKASDIHMEPARDCLKIRYRVDGILLDGLVVPKKAQASLTSRIKIMADMDIAEKRAPQDGRISATIERKQYDFRVSTLPAVFGEKIVMRVLDKSNISVGLHKLGLLPHTFEMFESMIMRTYGIILVTGPTGSGKSTTLYSCLAKVNSGEKNILTIEDPVEYELSGITQVGVNNKAGMTFAAGLRSMLRQDPDIIMVGEMRDQETAMIAIEAALTGHLVFSTLHTNDAPGAVARLMDMGVEPFLIASATIGVMAQRLLRKVCEKCKQPYEPPRDAIKRLGMNLDEIDKSKVTFFRGRGCDVCKGSGYKGRVGCYELMPVTDKVRELILAHASAYAIREAAIEAGMKSLKEDAMEKILLGVTTLEESLRVIYAG
ncbi:MAG: Flp pilus assembly complex ATPase component TadA [Cytophagales bacterium]|nr:Flp pilus assembly complex ATPase component TadA [Armatimonadota bacterium]